MESLRKSAKLGGRRDACCFHVTAASLACVHTTLDEIGVRCDNIEYFTTWTRLIKVLFTLRGWMVCFRASNNFGFAQVPGDLQVFAYNDIYKLF